ncbi:hypothetical protein [Halobacteriovorax sp. YZS-1-1]|uniref:hypothetical protein n=1 Tax=unclassified Halobacteriovorax TaxID=2639665 RepID=UPI00399C08EB
MNLNSLNRSMYMTAQHLYEASKHMMSIHPDYAERLLLEADQILQAIQVPKEKVSEEKLDDILNEILNTEIE